MRRSRRGGGDLRVSLTPMIDVTFLLIIFFVVVSQIVDAERVRLDLPSPEAPRSAPPDDEGRVVVNVLPGDSPGEPVRGFRVGTRDTAPGIEGLADVRRLVAARLARGGDHAVHVRADRATPYRFVAGVLGAVRGAAADAGVDAGSVRLHLALVRESGAGDAAEGARP